MLFLKEKWLVEFFFRMLNIIIGKKGDIGFKGCFIGIKVILNVFGKVLFIVELINDYMYKGIRKDFEGLELSNEKCGSELEVFKDILILCLIGIFGGLDNMVIWVDLIFG